MGMSQNEIGQGQNIIREGTNHGSDISDQQFVYQNSLSQQTAQGPPNPFLNMISPTAKSYITSGFYSVMPSTFQPMAHKTMEPITFRTKETKLPTKVSDVIQRGLINLNKMQVGVVAPGRKSQTKFLDTQGTAPVIKEVVKPKTGVLARDDAILRSLSFGENKPLSMMINPKSVLTQNVLKKKISLNPAVRGFVVSNVRPTSNPQSTVTKREGKQTAGWVSLDTSKLKATDIINQSNAPSSAFSKHLTPVTARSIANMNAKMSFVNGVLPVPGNDNTKLEMINKQQASKILATGQMTHNKFKQEVVGKQSTLAHSSSGIESGSAKMDTKLQGTQLRSGGKDGQPDIKQSGGGVLSQLAIQNVQGQSTSLVQNDTVKSMSGQNGQWAKETKINLVSVATDNQGLNKGNILTKSQTLQSKTNNEASQSGSNPRSVAQSNNDSISGSTGTNNESVSSAMLGEVKQPTSKSLHNQQMIKPTLLKKKGASVFSFKDKVKFDAKTMQKSTVTNNSATPVASLGPQTPVSTQRPPTVTPTMFSLWDSAGTTIPMPTHVFFTLPSFTSTPRPWSSLSKETQQFNRMKFKQEFHRNFLTQRRFQQQKRRRTRPRGLAGVLRQMIRKDPYLAFAFEFEQLYKLLKPTTPFNPFSEANQNLMSSLLEL